MNLIQPQFTGRCTNDVRIECANADEIGVTSQPVQMQVVSRKMAGRLVVPAFGLQMGNHWKPIRSYKGHSWHCFPSVPSVEVMTCDTVQKRAMAS